MSIINAIRTEITQFSGEISQFKPLGILIINNNSNEKSKKQNKHLSFLDLLFLIFKFNKLFLIKIYNIKSYWVIIKII